MTETPRNCSLCGQPFVTWFVIAGRWVWYWCRRCDGTRHT